MRKMQNFFGTMALAFMFCLTCLVLSGTAFADRCVDNGDGTVTDNGTGLMWQKATAGPMNWDAAKRYASGLSLGGYSGWRLPNVYYLKGLYNSPCKDVMDVRMEWYWSSSTNPYTTLYAWVVRFSNGEVGNYNMSGSYYVRAVLKAQ